jgi:hypothetical protein
MKILIINSGVPLDYAYETTYDRQFHPELSAEGRLLLRNFVVLALAAPSLVAA